jgi:hypothetical protein
VINFRKIGVHVRKPVDHLVTTSARRTCRWTTMSVHALSVGAKYKSFTDLECALKKFQQDNYVQHPFPSSMMIDENNSHQILKESNDI